MAPLTNRTVEWRRQRFAILNKRSEPDQDYPAVEGFVFEDRREGGFNYGDLDSEQVTGNLRNYWKIGAGRPRFEIVEVVAVRGERCAALLERVDDGSGFVNEGIDVLQTNEEGDRLLRQVLFDADDRDAAIAELDRMHAEISD